MIALNGVSSSGKSTLAAALTHGLAGIWLRLGVDLALSTMPDRFHADVTLLDADDRGALPAEVARLERGLQELAAGLCRSGSSLVLDLVCQRGGADQATWRHALEDVPMAWVRVEARPEVVAAREAARSDRQNGLSDYQHHVVHRGVDYDARIETSYEPADRLARRLAAELFLPWVMRTPLRLSASALRPAME